MTTTDPQTTVPARPRQSPGPRRRRARGHGAGNPAPYTALWSPLPDVTLFGAWGPIERGHDAVTSTFTWVGSRFPGGAMVPRHDVIGVSGDLAYTGGSSTARCGSTAATRSR